MNTIDGKEILIFQATNPISPILELSGQDFILALNETIGELTGFNMSQFDIMR
jgi:hypothetical protein